MGVDRFGYTRKCAFSQGTNLPNPQHIYIHGTNLPHPQYIYIRRTHAPSLRRAELLELVGVVPPVARLVVLALHRLLHQPERPGHCLCCLFRTFQAL